MPLKNLFQTITLLFFCIVTISCAEKEAFKPETEEPVDSENPYSVAFTVPLENNSRGRLSTEETDYSAYILMVDLSNPMDSMFSKRVKLLREGDILKTEPLKFGISEVELHLFIVYDKDGVHSVAPLSGSVKAGEVQTTLPKAISIPKDELLTLEAPELLPVGTSEPNDFGLGHWNDEEE